MTHLTDTKNPLALHVCSSNDTSTSHTRDRWLPRVLAGQLDVGELDDA